MATKNANPLVTEANAILAGAGFTKGGTPKARKGASKGKPKPNAPKPKPGNKPSKAEAKAAAEHKAAQGNRGTPTAEPLKCAKKPNAKTTEVSEAASGATRANWRGFSITSVLRYCGSKGWNVARCKVLVAALGVPLRENCVKAQCGSGRRVLNGKEPFYGPLAGLNKEQYAELCKLAPEA